MIPFFISLGTFSHRLPIFGIEAAIPMMNYFKIRPKHYQASEDGVNMTLVIKCQLMWISACGLKLVLSIYLSAAALFILCEIVAIRAEFHVIFRDPLTGVASALRGYLDNTRGHFKVHLQPLVVVIIKRGPRTYSRAALLPMESGIIRPVVSIQWWRRCYLIGTYSATLHTQRLVTPRAYEENNSYIFMPRTWGGQ